MGEKIKESNSEFVGLGQCVPYSIELFKKNEFHKEHSEIEVSVTPTSPTVTPADNTSATTATATSATSTSATATSATSTSAPSTSATSTSPPTTFSTISQQTSQETTFSTPNTSRRQRTRIKRKAVEQESDSMMHEPMQILKSSVNSSNDAYFTYALNLANELRKFDQNSLAHVKTSLR
ncbi:uncharacterized protein isoform X2 [Leptinotarsa decemlineata]|uniref:uncharacterized protein isoform X2 n=1 Tax=Leptinotarsa decemlineata TaxID=7539 RepID=UPI000C2555D6|nr:protein PRY2-like isoform X2 [Leptinotarsa decemlineata]XP_023021056.1 protein PRY2-like isoform X2 [Leptinotarsa decemlineata]